MSAVPPRPFKPPEGFVVIQPNYTFDTIPDAENYIKANMKDGKIIKSWKVEKIAVSVLCRQPKQPELKKGKK